MRHQKRTLPQNARMHAMLTDISRQIVWAGRRWDVKAWKTIVVGTIHGQEIVPNMNGDGVIVINRPTSKMDKVEVSDIIEQLFVFGAEHGVKWSDPNED